MLCPMFAVVLVVGLGPLLVGAFPQDAPKKTCRLSQYGSLVSSELMAVQKLREHFVSTNSNVGRGLVGEGLLKPRP